MKIGGRDRRDAWRLFWVVTGALCLFDGAVAPLVPRDNMTDTVKVISVENMDALLRLRLATEVPVNKTTSEVSLNSLEFENGSNNNRTKRSSFLLCDHEECLCNSRANVDIKCVFKNQQELNLTPETVPSNVATLHIENLGRLTVSQKTFDARPLYQVNLSNIGTLHFQSDAFFNITSSSMSLDIKGCRKITFSDHTFNKLQFSVGVSITDCDELIMGAKVFSRLLRFSAINVPKASLVGNTFSFESSKSKEHGPAVSILFYNVTIDNIENATFKASVAEIMFEQCKISKISSGAFSLVELSRLALINTKLNLLQQGAFSDKLLIIDFTFENASIGTLEPGALPSAMSNFRILNSRITEVRKGAINVTAAKFILEGNEFGKIARHAIEIQLWSSVQIVNNIFRKLEEGAFTFPFINVVDVTNYSFSFEANELHELDAGGLDFIPVVDQVIVSINRNIFLNESCSCHIRTSTRKFTASADIAERLYLTSDCKVTNLLADCYNLHAGIMTMTNYTFQVCGPGQNITCPEQSRRTYLDGQDFSLNFDNEARLIKMVFITVLACVTFIILVVIVRWVQRKGLVGRIISQLFRSSSLVTTASISRVNIHEYAEYAEIQNLQNQTQTVEDNEEEFREVVSVDDKATQTLPEELTQDLLQSLREKLDDPENYREARQMIEHLYDIIKVEESCNNRQSTAIEDTMYAELQPRTRRRVRNREMISSGTDSPSLENLAPVHYLPRPTMISDYAEPRDNQVPSNLYCELFGGVPDLVAGSNIMANRPLPDAPTE